MTCPMMMSLGVYVLGAADPAERRRLEAHLPGCQECLAELRRLAPLPGLLAGIPESVRAAPQAPGRQAVPPRRAQARGRTRRHLAVAAAACLAAGVTGGVWLWSGSGERPATRLTFAGTDSATRVSATATVTADVVGLQHSAASQRAAGERGVPPGRPLHGRPHRDQRRLGCLGRRAR